jgi:hypothetical protein
MADLRWDVLVKWHSRDFLLAIYLLFFVTTKYPVKLVNRVNSEQHSVNTLDFTPLTEEGYVGC